MVLPPPAHRPSTRPALPRVRLPRRGYIDKGRASANRTTMPVTTRRRADGFKVARRVPPRRPCNPCTALLAPRHPRVMDEKTYKGKCVHYTYKGYTKCVCVCIHIPGRTRQRRRTAGVARDERRLRATYRRRHALAAGLFKVQRRVLLYASCHGTQTFRARQTPAALISFLLPRVFRVHTFVIGVRIHNTRIIIMYIRYARCIRSEVVKMHFSHVHFRVRDRAGIKWLPMIVVMHHFYYFFFFFCLNRINNIYIVRDNFMK